MKFSTMHRTFWYVIHSNPAFYIIFFSAVVCYISACYWAITYFDTLGLKILFCGIFTLVIGVAAAVVHGITQDDSDFKEAFRKNN